MICFAMQDLCLLFFVGALGTWHFALRLAGCNGFVAGHKHHILSLMSDCTMGGIARIIFKHDSLHLPTTDFCMRFWSRRGSLGAKRAFWTQDHSGFSVRTSFSSAEIHQEEYGARTDPFMLHVSWLSLGWSVAVVVGAGCSWTWIQIVIWTACTQTFTVLGSLANRQDLKCYAVHVYIIAQTIDFLRLTY